MEYVDGQNLAQAAIDPMQPKDAADSIRQAAEAIHYAHERGVVHRDLKPSNILLDPSGAIRITDFGLAKRLESADELTLPGHSLGTPAYMAPEQFAVPGTAHPTVSPSVDIYSLGATLYHLLTSRPPFVGQSLNSVLAQVAQAPPVSPRLLNPLVPRDLETICLKCLAKTPERRYQTAQELADDLSRFCRGEPIRARPISPFEQGWLWCPRNPVTSLSLAAILGLLLILAITSSRSAQHIATLHREALTNLYAADMRLASQAVAESRFGFALDLLNKYQSDPNLPDLRGFEWYCLRHECQNDELASLGHHAAQAQPVACSQDGRWALSAADDARSSSRPVSMELCGFGG